MGFETDMFETSTGGWAAIRIDDVIESQLRPFEDVKNMAIAQWKNQKTGEALDELMLELAGKAQTGESLASLAAGIEKGGELNEYILLRVSPNQTLGQAVTAGLFGADIGDIERGPGRAALTREIGKLTEIVSNQDGLAGVFAEQLQDQLTADLRGDLNRAYQNAVLSENPLREYPDTVKQALGLNTDG